MTRLTAADIADVPDGLEAYGSELQRKTGRSLIGIACHGAGVPEDIAVPLLERTTAAVVPVSSGQGLIPGFAAAVCAILRFIGLRAFATGRANVAGLAEAVALKSELVFLSDDDDFVALNPVEGRVAHNAECTGKGFAAGLDLMAGGLAGKRVLVIGCGPVGRGAALYLLEKRARVTVIDPAADRRRDLVDAARSQNGTTITVATDVDDALRGHRYIVDATPAADFIDAALITARTYIAAPGVPLGLTAAAAVKAAPRLLHDRLQIGVAAMAVASLAPAVNGQMGR